MTALSARMVALHILETTTNIGPMRPRRNAPVFHYGYAWTIALLCAASFAFGWLSAR